MKDVETKLAEMCAEENRRKILEDISGIECDKGGTHSGKLWRMRKKLFPRSCDPPTAMTDNQGNLVTSKKKIEDLTIDTYKRRLVNRTILENLNLSKNIKKISVL